MNCNACRAAPQVGGRPQDSVKALQQKLDFLRREEEAIRAELERAEEAAKAAAAAEVRSRVRTRGGACGVFGVMQAGFPGGVSFRLWMLLGWCMTCHRCKCVRSKARYICFAAAPQAAVKMAHTAVAAAVREAVGLGQVGLGVPLLPWANQKMGAAPGTVCGWPG